MCFPQKGGHLDQPALERAGCRQAGTIQLMDTGWEGGLFTWPTGAVLANQSWDVHKVVWLHFTNNGRMQGLNGIRRDQVQRFFANRLGLSGDPWGQADCKYEDE